MRVDRGGRMNCSRRTFLVTASGIVLASRPLGAQATSASIQGANDRIRIGIIGTGGRARGMMTQLKRLPGTELVAVCDVYEPRRLQAIEIAGTSAVQHIDYRRILDDRQID